MTFPFLTSIARSAGERALVPGANFAGSGVPIHPETFPSGGRGWGVKLGLDASRSAALIGGEVK